MRPHRGLMQRARGPRFNWVPPRTECVHPDHAESRQRYSNSSQTRATEPHIPCATEHDLSNKNGARRTHIARTGACAAHSPQCESTYHTTGTSFCVWAARVHAEMSVTQGAPRRLTIWLKRRYGWESPPKRDVRRVCTTGTDRDNARLRKGHTPNPPSQPGGAIPLASVRAAPRHS